MEWTFDPLEIKNAYFNLERLGAIARRYNVNQYGITNSRPAGISAHRPPGCGVVDDVASVCRRCCRPGIIQRFTVEERIEVPRRNLQMEGRSRDPRQKAAEVQSRNRELFQAAFSTRAGVSWL